MHGTRTVATLLAAALLAAHINAAQALDIDRIEINSRLGEPLRAEIPVNGTTEELQALQAQLAAPVTFARIGLPRPQGVVADLRFAVVRAPGGAVIRVTSAMPVEEDFLTFLIQLDWGGGRMVREYSVALADDSLPASLPPPVQSVAAAPSDRVLRAPDAGAVELPVEVAAPIPLAGSAATDPPVAAAAPIPLASAAPKRATDVPARVPVPEPASKTAVAAPPAAKPAPASAAEPAPTHIAPAAAKPAPSAIPASSKTGGEPILVEGGDTLTAIASRVDRGDHTLDQVMLALLRANPDAFARGNINLLRRGAVLRVPTIDALSRNDAAQAAAVVAEQIRQWRDGEMPAMHPAALADEAKPPATHAAPAVMPRLAPPRLEIVPPAAQVVATSFVAAQSGIASARRGNELRPEASTDVTRQVAPAVQIEQMQARIAELEALQRDQQKLIALQDSALAARPWSGGWSWAWLVAVLGAVFASGWALARWRTGKRLARAAASAESQHARPAWHDGGNEEPEPV